MNFYRLRFINTLLLFIIGIFIGYFFNKNIFNNINSSYKPVYPPKAENNYELKDLYSNNTTFFYNKNIENNPMDEDEEYLLQVDNQDNKKDEIKEENNSDINIELFVKSPKDFVQKNISGKLQMIITKKTDKGWRMNFVYTNESKDLNYIYIDDLDNISGVNLDYKIGYFYSVRFYSSQGDLKKGNKLISISPTGEKVSWASGVNAVEY